MSEAQLEAIRERLARSGGDDPQLRVMLVLAHEAIRQRERAARAIADTGWEEAAEVPTAASVTSVNLDDYAALVVRIRETVSRLVPAGAGILVVSKGDQELLVPGYDAAHFPQGQGRAYAGHYPADGEAAVAHLEQCRSAGAEFFVLPATAYWWLEYYSYLAQRLLATGWVLIHDEHCLIFDLRTGPAGETPR